MVMPGQPEDTELFPFTDFGSLNTKSPRMSIEDNEFSWNENFIPIGKGNLRTMWGKGSNIYVQGGGKTIVRTFFWHSGQTGYGIVILSDGTAVQFNTSTGATTTVSSVANRFYNGGNLPDLVAWSSNGVLIVTDAVTDGYFAWDGTTLFKPGDTAPSWLSGLSASLTPTGSTHTSTTIDTMSSTTGIQVGMTITGTDIPAGTTVASIVSSTSITISQAATGSHGSITFTLNWSMPTGVSGTSIEVFQNRVWISKVATIIFSPASNGANFAASIGGGSFILTDSFTQAVSRLRQANGYLYIFCDSGINYIGNVQTTTSNGVTTTTFNNLNTDPQTGTPWPYSVQPYGRGIMLANTAGIYAMFGGSADKVSDKLDGLFASATLPLTGLSNMPSAAVATIFGIRIFFLLVTAVDPFTSSSRPILCAWDGTKWFICSQELNCTFISTFEIASNLQAWGTDGTNVFQMFFVSSSSLTKKFKGKLWSGKSYLIDKQLLGVYTEGYDNSGGGYSLSLSVDTETNTTVASIASGGGTVTWINSNGTVTWTSSNGTVVWTVPGVGIQGNDPNGVYGKLLGFTGTTTSPDFTIVDLSMLYKNYRFYR